MRSLLSSTCLIAIAATAASPAAAEVVISTQTTTPVATATANDDLRITTAGAVRPTSGVAVTLNSNDSVTNQGTIAIEGANNSAGIVALPGFTGNITNSGTITINENYTPTDGDTDGDLDGLFAQGNNRFGIHVLPGGTFTGTITHSGGINVEGNNSAGIAIDSILDGSLIGTGNIAVLGNDIVGIRTDDVTGSVRLTAGSITAQGEDAVGVLIGGDVGGAFVVQGSVSSTGYRYTTVPTDPSKLDADDLLQGGSAVVVAGNVGGGVLFDTRPADNSTTDTDEDDDGVADANEPTAAIVSVGAAPAVLIGSTTQTVTLGAVSSSTSGHGLVNRGSISGNGLYDTIAGNGVVIGGTGQAVTVAGGMTNTGTIAGRGTNANGTAVRIGAGATVPAIVNTGTINATGGGTATTGARGIVVDAGATVNSVTNSGTILATRAGTAGTATAILDNAGTVTQITNTGTLGVVDATGLGDSGIAIDVRANTTGVTVNQNAVTTGQAPTIAGNVLFGSGNDTFTVADGLVRGDARFGAGNNSLALSGDAVMIGDATFGAGNDSFSMAGTSVMTGDLNFGGGTDTLSLAGTSIFQGALTGGTGLAVNVGAGTTLDLTNTGTVDMGSLTTGAGSTLGVTLNSSTGAVTLYNVAGAATFGADTSVKLNLLTVGNVTGTYKIVDAGTLTGFDNLVTADADLPFLFAGELAAGDPGEVLLEVRVKTAEELGLNASEGGVLGAALDAADADSPIANVFLGLEDSDQVSSTLQQLLPEHAGGAFENATKGSRLVANILADPRSPVVERGDLGLWLQQVAWGTSKSIGDTASYDLTGWGAAGGLEHRLGGMGSVGVTLAFLSGKDSNLNNELLSNVYEGGVYWRGGEGPLRGFARATAAAVNFDGRRFFEGELDGETVLRQTDGDWNGRMYSATAGVSYEMRTGRFTIRPLASVEYYKLDEDGYTEAGGGEAFDLTVRDRKSDETAVNGLVAFGYDLLSLDPEQPWMRIELEGGRRQILSGSLGSTTASFGDGNPFTLVPEERTSGWRAALRLMGGGPTVGLIAEVSGEEQQGKASIGARFGIRFAL